MPAMDPVMTAADHFRRYSKRTISESFGMSQRWDHTQCPLRVICGRSKRVWPRLLELATKILDIECTLQEASCRIVPCCIAKSCVISNDGRLLHLLADERH
jgi:hypothetical protein